MDTLIDRQKLLKRLSYLIILIFIFNLVAGKLYWYSSIWWFDMPMHFLGGVWVGLILIYLFRVHGLSNKTILGLLLGVLLVGVGWEFFEFAFVNPIAGNPFNTLDTLSDIFFDLAGGAFALLYFLKRIVIQ